MSSAVSLSRSDAMWIRAHRKELGCLPEPGVTWQWPEVDVPHRLLCAMRHRSLIEKTADGWRTRERLYARLEEKGWVRPPVVLVAPDDGGQTRFASFVAPE